MLVEKQITIEVRKLTTNIKLVTCKNCIKRILKKRGVR